MPPPGSEPFLRAICDAPADDAPRLVYADWLDDHGQPERAEFIRLQCEMERPEVVGDKAQRLFDQVKALFKRHRAGWAAELPGHPSLWQPEVTDSLDWLRGFPYQVSIADSAKHFRAVVGVIADTVPVRVVRFRVSRNSTPVLEELTALPFFQRVHEIYTFQSQIEDAGVVAVAKSRHCRNLTLLHINGTLTDAAGHALIASPYLNAIRYLYLHRATFSPTVRASLRARFGRAYRE